MSDDDQKNSAVTQTQTDDVATTSPSGDEYDVEMWWVKDVKEGDAKQAEVTMKALMSAGLKPRLVAHALEKGHGYSIETAEVKQRFNNLKEAVGELAVTEEGVGAYEVVEKPLLTPGEHLEQMVAEEGLVKAEVVSDIEQIRERGGENKQKVEMTVIVKKEPPKLLQNETPAENNSNTSIYSGGFVRIEDLKTS